MHITRTEVIKLFEAFGCKTADKWNKKQMNKKIINIDEMLNDYTKGNPETDKTLDSIMTAIENNDEIVVNNDLSEKEDKKEIDKIENCDVRFKEYPPISIEEMRELDPPKKLKINKPKKVRILKSRSYYAGVIIRKYGISVGISEAMVNELDKLCGKKNREESDYRLRLAWHSIAGFCGIEVN